jgi:hypothetical protein
VGLAGFQVAVRKSHQLDNGRRVTLHNTHVPLPPVMRDAEWSEGAENQADRISREPENMPADFSYLNRPYSVGFGVGDIFAALRCSTIRQSQVLQYYSINRIQNSLRKLL